MTTTENVEIWKKHIYDCKSSGLKVDEWCIENHLSRNAYYYWHRRVQDFQESKSENLFVEVPRTTNKKTLKSDDEGILIQWNDFSISVKNVQGIPLMSELMQRLVKGC